jgi:hypothetical protein
MYYFVVEFCYIRFQSALFMQIEISDVFFFVLEFLHKVIFLIEVIW